MNLVSPLSVAEQIQYAQMRLQGQTEEEASLPFIRARLAHLKQSLVNRVDVLAVNRFEKLVEVEEELDRLTSQIEAIKPFETTIADKEHLEQAIPGLQDTQKNLKKELDMQQKCLKQELVINTDLLRDIQNFIRLKSQENYSFKEPIFECGERICKLIPPILNK